MCLCPCVTLRLTEPAHYATQGHILELTFQYTCVSTDPVWFAFYYPFTYEDDQQYLGQLEAKYVSPSASTNAPFTSC